MDRPYQSWQEMNEGLIANWTGGAYTVWNLEPWEVPDEIGCGNLICGAFWNDNKLICGKGDTPDEAKRDLINRIRG